MVMDLPKSSRGPRFCFFFFFLFFFLMIIFFPQLLAQQQFEPSPTTVWIVLGNATSELVPSCSDLCVQVYLVDFPDPYPSLQNYNVVLYPCQGLASNEFWKYDNASQAIQFEYLNTTWCLDYDNTSTDSISHMVLSSCNASEHSQRWFWDAGDMKFRSGLVDQAGHALYLAGAHTNNYSLDPNVFPLYLDSAEQDNILLFTQMPFADPLAIGPAQRLPDPSYPNLVLNGGFENCSLNPRNGTWPMSSGDPIPLCSWLVLKGQVDYVSKGTWLPQEGNYSIHLQNFGSVRQILPTRNGSTYNLTFHLAGNPTPDCGDPNKSLSVELLHTNVTTRGFSFNVTGKTPSLMGWIATDPILFVAQADYVNLTFTSTFDDPGTSCGPAIDNVRVQEIQATAGATPSSSSKSWKIIFYVCTAAVAVFAIVILVDMQRRMRLRPSRRITPYQITIKNY